MFKILEQASPLSVFDVQKSDPSRSISQGLQPLARAGDIQDALRALPAAPARGPGGPGGPGGPSGPGGPGRLRAKWRFGPEMEQLGFRMPREVQGAEDQGGDPRGF